MSSEIKVSSVKAKDGTAGISIADSTGNVSLSGSLSAGTIGANVSINADALPNKHNKSISRVTGSGFNSTGMDPVDTTWTITNVGNSDEVVTESGGIFSFPSTGIWKVAGFNTAYNSQNEAFNLEHISINQYYSTDSGSNYTHAVSGQNYITFPADDWYRQNLHSEYIYDITNKDTFRFKFTLVTNPSGNCYWSWGPQAGGWYFIKLGET